MSKIQGCDIGINFEVFIWSCDCKSFNWSIGDDTWFLLIVKIYNTASSNQFLQTLLMLLASKWATLFAISDLWTLLLRYLNEVKLLSTKFEGQSFVTHQLEIECLVIHSIILHVLCRPQLDLTKFNLITYFTYTP
jgi:hypothetical protein